MYSLLFLDWLKRFVEFALWVAASNLQVLQTEALLIERASKTIVSLCQALKTYLETWAFCCAPSKHLLLAAFELLILSVTDNKCRLKELNNYYIQKYLEDIRKPFFFWSLSQSGTVILLVGLQRGGTFRETFQKSLEYSKKSWKRFQSF